MESIQLHRGYSLVELMVVLAIIATLLTVVITNQSQFNKTMTLSSTAYDIALTVRSAQTFGLGSRGAVASGKAGYGVHFSRDEQDTFILFQDTDPPVGSDASPDAVPGDYVYTSLSDAVEQTYAIGNGIKITDFCASTAGVWECASATLTSLDIVFKRPNPDVYVSTNGSFAPSVTLVCLKLSAPSGESRFVTVGSAGQIVANAASDSASCHD